MKVQYSLLTNYEVRQIYLPQKERKYSLPQLLSQSMETCQKETLFCNIHFFINYSLVSSNQSNMSRALPLSHYAIIFDDYGRWEVGWASPHILWQTGTICRTWNLVLHPHFLLTTEDFNFKQDELRAFKHYSFSFSSLCSLFVVQMSSIRAGVTDSTRKLLHGTELSGIPQEHRLHSMYSKAKYLLHTISYKAITT